MYASPTDIYVGLEDAAPPALRAWMRGDTARVMEAINVAVADVRVASFMPELENLRQEAARAERDAAKAEALREQRLNELREQANEAQRLKGAIAAAQLEANDLRAKIAAASSPRSGVAPKVRFRPDQITLIRAALKAGSNAAARTEAVKALNDYTDRAKRNPGRMKGLVDESMALQAKIDDANFRERTALAAAAETNRLLIANKPVVDALIARYNEMEKANAELRAELARKGGAGAAGADDGMLTKQESRALLMALHPDRQPTEENLRQASAAFEAYLARVGTSGPTSGGAAGSGGGSSRDTGWGEEARRRAGEAHRRAEEARQKAEREREEAYRRARERAEEERREREAQDRARTERECAEGRDIARGHDAISEMIERLAVGDKVIVTYTESMRGGEVTSERTVSKTWKELRIAGLKTGPTVLLEPGTVRGKGGMISDYGETIYWQPTINTPLIRVSALERVGSSGAASGSAKKGRDKAAGDAAGHDIAKGYSAIVAMLGRLQRGDKVVVTHQEMMSGASIVSDQQTVSKSWKAMKDEHPSDRSYQSDPIVLLDAGEGDPERDGMIRVYRGGVYWQPYVNAPSHLVWTLERVTSGAASGGAKERAKATGRASTGGSGATDWADGGTYEERVAARVKAGTFKVGDILWVSFGYSMTIIAFYEVTATKGKTGVTLVELDQRVTSGDAGYSGTAVPIPLAEGSRPAKDDYLDKRVTVKGNSIYVKIDGHYAHLWDGKPKYFNRMD